MAVGNPALGQVVWRELHSYAVACEYSDSISTEFASEVGEDGTIRVKLDTE